MLLFAKIQCIALCFLGAMFTTPIIVDSVQEAAVEITCQKPASVSAAGVSGTIEVQWVGNGTTNDYIVQAKNMATGDIQTFEATGTSYDISGLASGQYQIGVSAKCSALSSSDILIFDDLIGI